MNRFAPIIVVSVLLFVVLSVRNISGQGVEREASVSQSNLSSGQAAQTTDSSLGTQETSGSSTIPFPSIFKKYSRATVPAVPAEIFGIWDLESGERYIEKGVVRRWPMASLTKLMTAVVTLTHVPKDALLQINDQSFPPNDISLAPLPHGIYSASSLMRAMLIGSRNEAAETFAQSYGYDAFIAAMNAQAVTWGMHRTYFEEPTGLSAVNQSTAEEIRVMAQHIYTEFPEIFSITRIPTFTLQPENQTSTEIKSTNLFAGQADFLGGKTGYIDESQGNLLSIFRYEGRPLLLIVLGSDDRFGATATLFSWFSENYSRYRN